MEFWGLFVFVVWLATFYQNFRELGCGRLRFTFLGLLKLTQNLFSYAHILHSSFSVGIQFFFLLQSQYISALRNRRAKISSVNPISVH